jgi:putative membrane protein
MKNSTQQIAALGFAGLLTAMAPAFAQTTTGHDPAHPGVHAGATTTTTSTTTTVGAKAKLSAADRQFVMKAAEGGMAEVELGRLAASKGTDPDVKAFGQRMVDDHSKANDKLKTIATEEGVTLPTALKGEMKAMHDKLSKASGAEFDKMYMSHMVKDHQKDVKEFEKESTSGKDTDVKQFAADTLPTLREHLQMAQTTATKVGAMSSHASMKK